MIAFVTDTIKVGDTFVLVKAAATADAGSILISDAYMLALEKVTAGYTWRVYTRVAVDADAGSSPPTAAGTPGPGPVVITLALVLRGGVPSAPLVETLVAQATDWSSSTNHSISGAACSQATDLRVTTWWIIDHTVTVTPPAGTHDALLANADLGASKGRLAAIATDYTSLGATQAQNATTSGASTGTGLSFALRTGIVRDRPGLVDDDPGRVGLVA